jgi:hypothetical protein
MLKFEYGEKDYPKGVWKALGEGRAVLLKVPGRKRRSAYRTLSLYAEHDRLMRSHRAGRWAALRLLWRTLLSPSLIGLCQRAGEQGMMMTVQDDGDALQVVFQKRDSGPKP